MRASVQEILANYQVRKTVKQKRTFIGWLNTHAQEHGYQLKAQPFKKGRARNLIIGNPATAEVILTAHYDTPASAIFPIATIVGSIPMYLLSQLLIFVPVVGVFWVLQLGIQLLTGDMGRFGRLVPFLWFEIPLFVSVMLIIWCLQMMVGFANKKNANDNTSGVSVILTLLEDLSVEQREKVCFVLFDEEEKGLEGAKAFKSQFGDKIKDKPLINFDCVAHGRHLLFVVKKGFKNSRYYDQLVEVAGHNALIKGAIHYVYASDQLLFRNSVGVAAVHRIPLVGYYLSRLHSRFDTKFDVGNIEELKRMMVAFITQI